MIIGHKNLKHFLNLSRSSPRKRTRRFFVTLADASCSTKSRPPLQHNGCQTGMVLPCNHVLKEAKTSSCKFFPAARPAYGFSEPGLQCSTYATRAVIALVTTQLQTAYSSLSHVCI